MTKSWIAKRRTARLKDKTTGPVSPAAATPAPATVENQRYVRHVTGLELLARNGKISAEQRAAGERYGKLYRLASIQDVALIKSAIDFSAPGGGGKGKVFPGENDYLTAEGVMRARKALNEAQAALGRHSGLIAALDVVCGKEWTAAQVSDVRREQEEVVTGLRIGLDLLAKHFREADRETRAA